MPVRILHVVDNIGMGGLQNGLANLMDRLAPARFEHILCAMRPVEDVDLQPFPEGRFRLVSHGKHREGRRFQAGALVRTIREVNPHIVHSRNWAAIEAVFAGRWTGCRVIHSEHGLDSDTTAKEPSRRTSFRRLAFELAHRVISVSHHLRDLHAARTGFPARKITVIHNGVDHRRFFPDSAIRARVRGELGLLGEEFCIGCVGNLTPVKDHLTVLKSMDRLAKACANWRLIFIGDGPELANLAAYLDTRPAWKRRVSFLGRSTAVPGLLNAMDTYVLSSVTEGICNSLLEAMASGLPVVVTATGGNPEVVINRESGLLFPVGDAEKLADHLILLRNQSSLRQQLGQQALHRIRENFSVDSMVWKYEQLYESVAPAEAIQRSAVAKG